MCKCLVFNLSADDLKQLHSYASEHELEQSGDDHDVTDGSDGHKHTLHHVLQDKGHTRVYTLRQPLIGDIVLDELQDDFVTFRPLARLMALRGRRTRRTLRIFTTEMAEDLNNESAGL